MKGEITKRLAPFLALLDAKYAPLLFAVAPQAYSVYLWLFPKPYDSWGELFAILGALGFEWVYVGAIAWAEEGKSSVWTWATALVALVFSVLVAYYVHQAQGNWAWLHAGFPLVAFAYTLNMYQATHRKQAPAAVDEPATDDVATVLAVDFVPQPRPVLAQVVDTPAPVVASVAPVAVAKSRKQVTSPLAGVDVVAELRDRFGGSKQRMAQHYGVSRQAIDNRVRG
jgi:hypothetical protein